MKTIEIRVQFSNQGRDSQTIELDGITVRLDFFTNKADGSWYFETYDNQNVLLVGALGVVKGLDLWFPYRYKNLPPGPLFVNDQSGLDQDPGLDSFENKTAAVFYVSEGE